MSKYKRYDTPTDAISRKVFDRYCDKQEIRYGRLKADITKLERQMKEILQWKLRVIEVARPLPPPPKE